MRNSRVPLPAVMGNPVPGMVIEAARVAATADQSVPFRYRSRARTAP